MESKSTLREIGEDLHRQLLAGVSLTVTGEIAETFLPVVKRSLKSEFGSLQDQDLIDTAVEDAIFNYLNNPELFQPQRAGLFTYLRLRAKGYLLNALSQTTNYLGKHVAVEVEHLDSVYESGKHSLDLEDTLISRELDSRTLMQLAEILVDDVDIKLAHLMIDGVRETEQYARVLDVIDLTKDEQAKIVKRNKDRLKKKIRTKFRLSDE